MHRLRLCLGLAMLVAAAGVIPLDAECFHYDNSRIVYYGGQGYCAATGSGCTECVDGAGNSCVTNGNSCVKHPTP